MPLTRVGSSHGPFLCIKSPESGNIIAFVASTRTEVINSTLYIDMLYSFYYLQLHKANADNKELKEEKRKMEENIASNMEAQSLSEIEQQVQSMLFVVHML